MASTIDELIASIEVEKEAAEKRETKARTEIKMILDTASKEGRSNLTDEETQRTDSLFKAIDDAVSDGEGIKSKLARATKVKSEEMEAERRAKETKPAGEKRTYDDAVRIGAEERTYHRGNDPRGTMFIRDVCRNFLNNDVQATTRLARHMAEERVERAEYLQRAAGDTTTTNWAGLTVPQYLTDLVAPAVANLKPFADECTNKHQLPPDGLSVNISQVTTASSVALQASELAAVSATSLDDTLLTIPVQTAAGMQNVSRQAIDRGTGIEETVLQDLYSRYYTTLDNTLVNQASTGLSAVATAHTYTDASPTGPEAYPFVMGAAASVEASLLAMGQPTHVVMHSRRWYWFAKEMTNTWPMINSMNLPTQAAGLSNASSAYGSGVRGVFPNGLLVVVDNNIATNKGAGTNEDEIYVVPSRECHLWQDAGAPAFIRAEQPNAGTLGVLLVLYGYFAYTFSRYSGATQKVSGTGLIAPTGM